MSQLRVLYHPQIGTTIARYVVVGTLLFWPLQAGCVSHRKMVEQARDQYWHGSFAEAESNLAQARKRPKKDTEVLKLDQAMVHFSQGELAESATLLREVRDHFERPAIAGAAQKATSYLTDDNTRPYVGEDHEKILVRVLLTMIDLAQQQGDAVAYAHQVGESIEELLASREPNTIPPTKSVNVAVAETSPPEKPVQPPTDVVKEELAIAPLLRALVRKSSRMNQDDVLRNLKVATEWRSNSPFLMQELLASAEHQDIAPGHGSVYLIMFVGRGPVKQSVTEPVTSQALLIADQLLSAVGEFSLPPTIAPVKIAAMVPSPSNVDGMQVSIGGQLVGNMETIADLNRLAVARHQELLPQIIARAVVRRVVKKSVVVATKSQTNVQSELVSTAYNLAGVLWEASEQADLRCWSLLPGQIQILRVDLPVGAHRLVLYPTWHGQLVRAEPLEGNVEVNDGQTAFAIGTMLDRDQPGTLYSPRR
jgi:uncharacterized protein